jgi:conjugative relaxase-like TrwC/TraI family protein
LLSIGKLAAGPRAGLYYVDQVARGAEDYYAGEGEVPGRWIGTGAASLGLRGEVCENEIVRLLDARNPASGEPLRRPLPSGAVAGFDLTFRAPKSVSVLFGIADARVAGELRAAHAAAVAQAIGYLEREACRARRGAGGTQNVRGRGFVAGGFEHRSSRARDPLLHTHVVVANATQGPDGRWTALDGRHLYRDAKTAGYLYQAALRAQVSERLGLEWRPPANGVADLAVVPRGVIEHFSQRRAEIVAHMAERGERSARAAQIATLETRRTKSHDVPLRLRDEWRSRAAEHGLTARRLDRVARARGRRARIGGRTELLARRLEGPSGLTQQRSTFARRDVLQAFAEAARDGARTGVIEAQADAFLRRDTIVELEPASGERRFTTREMLAIERDALDAAKRGAGEARAIAGAEAVDDAVAARPSLSQEQRELVEALVRARRGVDVVRSPAGTGKTFALDAAREAWQRSGIAVLGCALSARAACELRDQAGVEAVTIARLMRELDRGAALPRGSALIVDEAGMVGTRDLARLIDAAEVAGGKLVLVGDDRQLPEIAAGGLFAALAERLPALELKEVRRQREPWDRDALAALRSGDVERFARDYGGNGRIVAATTGDAVRERLVRDWLDAHERGEQAVMIAHRRRDVADLNRRARERLRSAGRIGADELNTDAEAFAVGDRVIARRNDRHLGTVNGDVGRVTAIEAGQLRVEADDGRRLDLPESYARAGHLQHGYAITAHVAQGATVDRAFVLGSDELYREWGYTALSRHRAEARFYVSAAPTFLNEPAEPLRTADDVTDVAMRMLEESRAEQLAHHGAPNRELEHARQRLAEIEDGLRADWQRRDRLRWHQRAQRRRLDRAVDRGQRERLCWQREVEGLARELDRRLPARPTAAERGRRPERDHGIGLGR